MGRTGLDPSAISAVAAHGQTLFHEPPNTIQWLDPGLVAHETECAVVSDFRRADLAAGGQGAPLVPFADYILFRDPGKNRVLLNIGGIANITYLPANCSLQDVIAFDTGPGNCISDHLCRTRDPGGPGYDVDGARALRGNADTKLELACLRHRYFRRKHPKSTDGPEMIAMFEQALQQSVLWMNLPLDDLVATAASITVHSIRDAILRLDKVDEIIASGGGTQNKYIWDTLSGTETPVTLVGESSAKEAVAFALLAAATLDGIPSNLPSVTGARKAVVLGSITPRP
jgi:anhydro-N-acetylmuramic acid kinase